MNHFQAKTQKGTLLHTFCFAIFKSILNINFLAQITIFICDMFHPQISFAFLKFSLSFKAIK